MTYLLHLAFILVISELIALITCSFKCDNAALEKTDIAMSRGLNVGKFHSKFPETFSEVGAFCDRIEICVSEIEEYKTNCMKNLPKQMTSLINYAVRKMMRSLCRKNSKRLANLLNGAPCGNKAQLDYSHCLNKYIDTLQGIFYETDKRKIPLTCCEYYKYIDCMRATAKKHDICTEERVDANVEYVGDIFNDMLRVLCGDWTDDSDKCDKLSSPMKKRKSDRRTHSFLMPFIKVFDSFPEI